ncbi:MAG: hypothetical protein HC830_12565 [Bacteroidetes bacterium]|nr:hypothetical protein [Bacteroidota bacterium]
MLERYYQILGFEGFKTMISKPFTWKYGLGALGFPIKENNNFVLNRFKSDKLNTFPFLGKYRFFSKVNVNDTIIANGIKETFFEQGQIRPISTFQKSYFDKIVRLCELKKKGSCW